MRQQEQPLMPSRFLDELCALLFTALRFPKTEIPCAGHNAQAVRERLPPLSPGGFASLMLGITLSLMLSGSITFMIGCMMMPWVLGMAMLLYFIALLSSISMLWKMLLGLASSPSPSRSSHKGIAGWDKPNTTTLSSIARSNPEVHLASLISRCTSYCLATSRKLLFSASTFHSSSHLHIIHTGAIYALRQAPCQLFSTFIEYLQQLGFIFSNTDPLYAPLPPQ